MHANAGSPHASLPDSDVALLANILVLATRNMNNMTTMLAHLSVELSQSEEPRLQRVGHRVLNELSELGAALETQWDLIGALARFSPCSNVPCRARNPWSPRSTSPNCRARRCRPPPELRVAQPCAGRCDRCSR